MGYDDYYGWRPYVSVAERRRQAAQKIAKMKKAGRQVSPIEIAGRKIAATFWGDAWCTNLEAYSDYSNRLPRGRTYVRNGSVIDLQIEAGQVRALVCGSDIYEIEINIEPLAKPLWTDIKCQCAGQIGSLVELLRGSISKDVMEIVTRKGQGLFPTPQEISMNCSCPDWATMCKHVAATLYGVGARLDHEPEMLFVLRGVDLNEMLEVAGEQLPVSSQARRGRVLDSDDLASVFGVDIDLTGVAEKEVAPPTKPGKRAATNKKKADKLASASGKAEVSSKKVLGRADLGQAVEEKVAPPTKRGQPAATTSDKPDRPATAKRKAKTSPKNGRGRADLGQAAEEKVAPPTKRGQAAEEKVAPPTKRGQAAATTTKKTDRPATTKPKNKTSNKSGREKPAAKKKPANKPAPVKKNNTP